VCCLVLFLETVLVDGVAVPRFQWIGETNQVS
jgi:hypothetical protein